jgi:hypothetical protein
MSFRINQTGGYAEGMLDSIGTMDTYQTMMTLFPRNENGYKFRVRSSAQPHTQNMKRRRVNTNAAAIGLLPIHIY